MQILLTGPSSNDFGGVLNYYEILLRNINDMSIKFDYVEVGRSSNNSPIWKRPLDYFFSISRFIWAINKFRPDILQISPSLNWTSLPFNLALLITAKILYKNQIVVFFHGWRDEIGNLLRTKALLGTIIRNILFMADYYAVLSSSFGKVLVEAGFNADHILVTSMMVDTSRISKREIDSEEIARTFKILYLSRIEKDKGSRELIDAIKWLQKNHANIPMQFIIAGSGSDETHMRKELAREINTGLVCMPGYLRGDKKYITYLDADIYVLPSHHEGFPNTIIEAMAAGLPLIYTPVGALKDILGPENGICIGLGHLSGETLGESILKIYGDEKARTVMSENNRRLAIEKYDISIVSKQIMDFYKSIIAAD